MYDLGTYETTTSGFTFNPVSSLISIAFCVLSIVALWKLFEKMGIEGWKSIIPVYNLVIVFQQVELNPWLLLLCLIPCLGWIAVWVLSIIAYVRLARKFGQNSGAFIVLIVLFAPIALAVLAFDDKYKYTK